MDKDDVFLSSSGMANADSDHKAEALRELEDFRTLHSILIRIGGWETVFAHDEPDMKAILERGRYFPGKSLSISGRPSQCHDNVRSFYANPTKKTVGAKICTGYALSEDGFWRQHSWLYQPYTTSGGKETFRIIETTVKRLAYFGFIMTDAEAQKFINQ